MVGSVKSGTSTLTCVPKGSWLPGVEATTSSIRITYLDPSKSGVVNNVTVRPSASTEAPVMVTALGPVMT